MIYKNQKRYKYYLFYKIDSGNQSIYAYTDSKEVSLLFENRMDSKLFKKEKNYLTSDEIQILYEKCPGGALSIRTLETCINNKKHDVEIALTENEYIDVLTMDERIKISLATSSFINPFLFKHKYTEALSTIKYLASYLYNSKTINTDMDNRLLDYLENDYDNLSIFIYLYGK